MTSSHASISVLEWRNDTVTAGERYGGGQWVTPAATTAFKEVQDADWIVGRLTDWTVAPAAAPNPARKIDGNWVSKQMEDRRTEFESYKTARATYNAAKAEYDTSLRLGDTAKVSGPGAVLNFIMPRTA